MDLFLSIIKKLGGFRLTVIVGALGLLVGFFIYVMNGMNQSDMATLYSNLDPAEGGQIVSKLEALSIPHFVEENGTHIEVPRDEIGRLRMILAEAGLPSGGMIGYEIFDRNEPFGMTSFVQDVNHLRALEGELARSIRTLAKVVNARVHLVLPKRELFSKNPLEPSASIVLKMAGASRLSTEQVEAIVHLVASAVSGLSPNNISVIDNKGILLTRPSDKDATGITQENNAEIRSNYETRMGRMVESLLEKSVGLGKVRAEVTADLNFDQFSENAEIYDPDGQVIRSTQTSQEGSSSTDASSQAVTVENNLPKSGNTGSSDQGRTDSNRKEEAINYEISKTIRTHVKEFGGVKRISVAVMVDGLYDTTDSKAPPKYKPRAPEELEQLKKLVQSAVGYQKERGDQVEVFNLAFVESDTLPEEEEKFINLTHTDILHLIELAVIIVMGLIVIMTVIKPAVNRLIEGALAEKALAPTYAAASPSNSGQNPSPPKEVSQDEVNKQFNLGKIEGEVRASTLSSVAKIIEENPDKTINLLRSWMAEETSPKKGKTMNEISSHSHLSGPEKAALLVLTLSEDVAGKIFQQMEEWEIIALSQKMAALGSIDSQIIEGLFKEFAQNVSSVSSIVGNIESTERLLRNAVGREQASRIIEELSGPAGRTMWDKLGNVNEGLLADYLKHEHPQTVAVVLSKVKTDQSAKILAHLPDEFAVEVVLRLLKIDSVPREVVGDVESTLRAEFMNNFNRSAKRDTYEILADTFSAMDRTMESKFIRSLEQVTPDSAEKIKALMFKFEDLSRLDQTGIQTLLRVVASDGKNLAYALKGASGGLKDLFFANMSERAVKLLRADIVALGSVRLKDVENAQMNIISTAKNLIEQGQLTIKDREAEPEEMIS